MFENIGGKLKKLAEIITIIGSVLGILIAFVGLITCAQTNAMGALIGGILGGGFIFLVSWVGSFTTYAFGELVEKTTQIEINTRKCENLDNTSAQ